MRRPIAITMACLIGAAGVRIAHALPALQLYLEGATYDQATETWVGNYTSGGTLRLWAIGAVGDYGTISNVKLAIAYASGDDPIISLTGSTTGGLGGFTDASRSDSPTFIQTKTDGSVPKLTSGSSLPSHGVYGAGTAWSEYGLGNLAHKDSPVADFAPTFPSPSNKWGQINVYEITISGTDWVHFDLYDNYVSGSKVKYVFAPFSHDAEGNRVPDGGMTLLLLGLGIAGLGVYRQSARRR